MPNRYLIIEGSRAYLANDAGLQRAMTLGPVTALDLNQAANGFCGIYSDKSREFTFGDVASIAGITLSLAQKWYKLGIIRPARPGASGRGNVARYSYSDAFAAGVIGALYRQGVGVEGLRNAYRLLTRPLKIKHETTHAIA